MSLKCNIKAVLIDLSGTLHIGDKAIPGAVDALKKLRNTGVFVRFVTNTTKESKTILCNRLDKLGFQLDKNDIFSSLSAVRCVIETRKLMPMMLISKEAMDDFQSLELGTDTDANAVVVGLAPQEFHYERLNAAFRLLLGGAELIAIHSGKYYERGDGLALGPGCFVKGLEYSASVKADVIGKPKRDFFISALKPNISPEETIMIGDDVTDDVEGALNAGLMAVLVKTGKYRTGDETKISKTPNLVASSFVEAVDWILSQNIINN